jgi:muramoyltetrapeptide carboxypeptidase LdcA involved in peptidoglycan recycling
VITSIGGEDELKVLSHVDADLIAGHPKPFVGYSDNTNLHLFLWRLGLVSYHGGAVMVQLARAGSMHPLTRQSLEQALFARGTRELTPAGEYSDEEVDWRDATALQTEPPMYAAEDWSWHGPATRVSGPAWGGSLDVVDFHLRTGRYLPSDAALDGSILFLETSEELPPPTYVYRVLMCMGERGMLQRFAAVLWARPKAWSFESPNTKAEKARYVDEQREAVLAVHSEYHPRAPFVFGVDFGHTEPQYVIPSGGEVTVDSAQRRLLVTY